MNQSKEQLLEFKAYCSREINLLLQPGDLIVATGKFTMSQYMECEKAWRQQLNGLKCSISV